MTIIDQLRGARKSLTIWFNGLLLVALPVAEYAKDSLPQLTDFLAPDTYKAVGLAVVVVNIVLRIRTTTSLSAK